MNIKDLDPYDFSKTVIQGIPVYYKHLPWAPCLHIRFSFSAGAFNDPQGKEGLAHFLEHMVGNGSKSLPDKKAVKEFSRLYMLGSKNAFTSHESTSYVGKCLPEHSETVLKQMVEYISEPFIRPEDVEHERKVITQEAWQRYSNPKFLKYAKEFIVNLYTGHERGRHGSPLGWPEAIANITREDLKDFHSHYYNKENLTLMLVGAFDEKLLKALETILSPIPNGKRNSQEWGVIGKPLQMRMVKDSDEIGRPSEQVNISLHRVLPKEEWMKEEVASQARLLFYDVLFERLRTDNSLCYGVSVETRTYKDYVEMEVEVDTSEDKMELAEKEIWNILSEIVDGKWKERFAVVHKTYIDRIRSNERTSDSILGNAMGDLIRNGSITPLSQILEEAAGVTYEDTANFLSKFFDKDEVFTSILLPSKKEA
jgi:predicted Zn-dependent peptidase